MCFDLIYYTETLTLLVRQMAKQNYSTYGLVNCVCPFLFTDEQTIRFDQSKTSDYSRV